MQDLFDTLTEGIIESSSNLYVQNYVQFDWKLIIQHQLKKKIPKSMILDPKLTDPKSKPEPPGTRQDVVFYW